MCGRRNFVFYGRRFDNQPGGLSGTETVMTQELIANMLGVRREGVTVDLRLDLNQCLH
jgi:hypothetical protein